MLGRALVGTTEGRRESQEGLEASLVQLTLATLLKSFLRVGATGFGGGMAIIALMEQEIVRKLRAMSPDDFVAGVGLSQF